MANCHESFLDYILELNLTGTQESKLQTSRDALIERIRSHFRKEELQMPDFQSQGSYALNTQNRPISEDFDLDHGVYLKHVPDDQNLTVSDAFRLIEQAVEGHTSEPLPYKETCVRVQYKRNGETPSHHVDLAIYRLFSDGRREYAHRTKGWQPSDQKGFIDHFNQKKTDQTRALVRLFKGWSDYQGKNGGEKLPSGFHHTVCVLECNFVSPERHDKAMVETANNINQRLKAYKTKTGKPFNRPVIPGEDVFSTYVPGRLDYFITKLDDLVREGKNALAEADPDKAKRIWQSLFGPRFKAPESKKETKPDRPWSAPAIVGTHNKAA
jgi:hypothetical protein